MDFVEDQQGGRSLQMDASSEVQCQWLAHSCPIPLLQEYLMMAAHSRELPDTLANIKQWSQGSRKTLVGNVMTGSHYTTRKDH